MKQNLKLAVIFCLAFTLSSCTTPLEDYQATSPQLDIQQYFSGKLIAWGMVQDYSSKVTRRFCVELDGQWQDDEGLLKEVFYFDDGEVTYRNWQLTKLKQGKYLGGAEDVVGNARGQQRGFAFQWQYDLLVPIDDDVIKLSLDDWMYQIDEYRVFNRTKMQKFGVTVAELTIFFDKQLPLRTCPRA
ncbi:DUF3833 domain-containing protein [Cognaticolwellia beringensis]|uniref:DUF3833 domain-containing protein n=1 Tax=Cognaticolwellia beringensis TaxID=1967665 RepID=A0A222G871_9GAMM|nr:DUF3833 domain-containing protein [Cognaticolwellia beringensis]ASP48069.1 DUF3833 domain-containing protein [Cognaticolwellia beringensis]